MRMFKAILTLMSVAIIVAFLRFENRLSLSVMGIALLFYLLSSAVHLLAHESGHFIGGVISGYKLICLQLGPLNVVNKNNKLSLAWKGSLSGQCIMIPKQVNSVRFKAYNLGGIFANILIVVLGIVLLLFDSFWSVLLFIELICVGVQKILINAVPHKTNSIPNDGFIVRLLSENTATVRDYAMYLNLYGQLFWGEEVIHQDYIYERELAENEDEMLYYNEIQDILKSVTSEKNTEHKQEV